MPSVQGYHHHTWAPSIDLRANCETPHPVGMLRSVEKAITYNVAFRRNASNGPIGEIVGQHQCPGNPSTPRPAVWLNAVVQRGGCNWLQKLEVRITHHNRGQHSVGGQFPVRA